MLHHHVLHGVLAEEARAVLVAVELDTAGEMRADGFLDHFRRDLVAVEAGEDPRVGDRAAPDHNRVDVGVRLHAVDIGDSFDIAAADDGNLYQRFDFGDGVPIGVACVALFFCAPVDGDQRAAFFFDDAGDEFEILVSVPAEADLAGDRHTQMFDQLAERARDAKRRRHHTHARATVRDGLGGTAHIEVDHVGVVLLHFQRRFEDEVGVFTVDLEGDWAFRFGKVHPLGGLFGLAEDLLHFDELGVAHGGTQLAANGAEGPVRIPVHGRENRVAVDGQVTDKKGGGRY